MNPIYLFQTWSYQHSKIDDDVELIMRELCKQEYEVELDFIEHINLDCNQAIELRNSSTLIQAIVAKEPGKIKIYDPRWLQPVAKAQLPAEHQYIDTPTILILPGYLWWQTLTLQPVVWLCGQKPNVDF